MSEQSLRDDLDKLQAVIDINHEMLQGLRTECEPTYSLIQQEIRTVEGKLIKLFSNQLILKEKLVKLCKNWPKGNPCNLPKLDLWLAVVGVNHQAIKCLCHSVRTLEALQDRSEHDIRLIVSNTCSEEELRRLGRALHNLRRFTEVLRRDGLAADHLDSPLHWDSWDACDRPAVPSPRLSRSKNMWIADDSHGNNVQVVVENQHEASWKSKSQQEVPKSRSDEFKTPNDHNGDVPIAASGSGGQRGRLATEPGPTTHPPVPPSPIRSSPPVPHDYDRTLQVPKSPRTPTLPRPGVMGHAIAHRFTKTFKVMTMCNYCEKQIFIGTGLKCTDCSYICHRDCESKVPPSCRLPNEMLQEYIAAKHSPHVTRSAAISPKHKPASRFTHNSRKTSNSQPAITIPPFSGGPDSSSTSSCNSSTPSSPAVAMHAHAKQHFLYPDVDRGVTLETHPLLQTKAEDIGSRDSDKTASSSGSCFSHWRIMGDAKSKLGLIDGAVNLDNHPLVQAKADEIGSRDSDKTVSASGSGSFSLSTDSDRTPVRVDSQDSQVSDGEPEKGWPRQNSLSIREWDIPYEDLKIGELVGRGSFATVYRGNWHGDVAVKMLDMNYLEDEKRLDAFKLEVSTFRKTRHENVILFMGACVTPQNFAIVTSLSKGMTLYTLIHERHEKFYLNKNISIAQQISQGMGYLHEAKGIIHKDLKSKNIFLENGRVVITDFGLFGVTKLCYGSRQDRDGLIIPPGWLCYLSSELMTGLRSSYQPDEELPFSKKSDVYAFGTVWYELLCGDWPFKGQPPESIIWQVGKGMKQSLANLQASRDVKDILMMCWSYRPSDRPDFATLKKTLDNLPKNKKLARSPSHPIHLSRSAESVF